MNEPRPYNPFDEKRISEQSFAFLDLTGQDKWTAWTPAYSFATATGLTVVGRFKLVGKMCFWQVKSSGTSIATTAGTSYIDMPVSAKGYGGSGVMANETTGISVGTGPVIVSTSRYMPPTQGASANTFIFSGSYEV